MVVAQVAFDWIQFWTPLWKVYISLYCWINEDIDAMDAAINIVSEAVREMTGISLGLLEQSVPVQINVATNEDIGTVQQGVRALKIPKKKKIRPKIVKSVKKRPNPWQKQKKQEVQPTAEERKPAASAKEEESGNPQPSADCNALASAYCWERSRPIGVDGTENEHHEGSPSREWALVLSRAVADV